jgi:2-oxoglutarate dehydrogenase dihydrolipoamide succinyltransferase (E2 component)
MKQDMVMPKMGESITEGTIIKWLKNVGDMVEKDEIILEISTDKVDSEIPTPFAGKIAEVLAGEGETVEVGNVIARIETDTDAAEPAVESKEKLPKAAAAESEKKPEPPAPEPKAAEPAPSPRQEEPPSTEKESGRFYSPVVLNIARTEGVSAQELDAIPGTGMGGRVTKKDILSYIKSDKKAPQAQAKPEAQPAPLIPAVSPGVSGDGIEIIPMDHIRKKIAEHMVHTVHTSPHVGLFIEVNMSNIYQIRTRNKDTFLKKEGVKLTYMPFVAEAIVKTLKEFPHVNASIDGENILVKHFINLGIAVATEQGLIVPVIKNTDNLNLTGIARAINDLATRARIRKLKPDEVSGGTFSISNFGVYGTTIGFPLINQPQVAILGVGALKKRPVVINDAIAIRPMMNISLSFDHRLIDGALGAEFLQRAKEHLESYDPQMTL